MKTIRIHGDEWKLSDITDQVELCKTKAWSIKQWVPRPALIDKKGGSSRLYTGQHYDKKYFDLVEDGWNHDHCQICWWSLFEAEDPLHSLGYTDGFNWICSECYELFIK